MFLAPILLWFGLEFGGFFFFFFVDLVWDCFGFFGAIVCVFGVSICLLLYVVISRAVLNGCLREVCACNFTFCRARVL